MAWKKSYTPEERAAYQRKQAQEMHDIFKRIDKGVEAVFSSEKYREYLKFVSKFTDYSARNTMLINLQRPDATLVGSYGLWKRLGRSVNKGESGIVIMSPVPHKTNQYVEIERQAEDEWGNKLYNDDGTEKMETIEKNVVEMAFKKQYVFDLSQTNGKPIPDPVQELSGEIDEEKLGVIFKAIKKVTGIAPEYRTLTGGAKGYYSPSANSIIIKSSMSGEQTLKTVIHESAHCLLHDPDKKIVTVKSPRNEKEVQAESIAFIVCEKLGVDTSEYSFPYIASWSEGKQLDQLNKFLDEIQKASQTIFEGIDSELLKYKKRDLTVGEIMDDTELSNVQKAEMYLDIVMQNGIVFENSDTAKTMEQAEKEMDIGAVFKLIDDTANTINQRNGYGYDFQYMDPIDTTEEALAAYDRGEAVYLLYPDGTEGMAENREEIESFSGLFGLEKEPKQVVSALDNPDLYPVSRKEAIEMWGRGLDVFIDGVRAESFDQIENAPDTAQLALSEYQYSAELDFDKIGGLGNVRNQQFYDNYNQQNYLRGGYQQRNNNIIGNTPYDQLGGRGQLQYYKGLNNRHAQNIARQLEADGVRYSGIIKGGTTTITINSADIPRYEQAVDKVKQMYDQRNGRQGYQQNNATYQQNDNPQQLARDIESFLYEYNTNGYRNMGRNRTEAVQGIQNDLATGNIGTITEYLGMVVNNVGNAQISGEANQLLTRVGNLANTRQQGIRQNNYQQPRRPNPNVIGNTPYEQLGNRNELQYYRNLKNRHADNIAAKLNEYGVRFSGLRKGYSTTITINRADIPRYEAAVAEVKLSYQQNSRANNQRSGYNQNNYQPAFAAPAFADRGGFGNVRPFTGDFDNIPRQGGSLSDALFDSLSNMPQRTNTAFDYKTVPIVVESYMDAKMNGRLSELQASIKASQACRDYIEQNIHSAYESRNLSGFVQNLVDKFGIDRAMYTVAATIQLKNHDGRFTQEVKDMARQYMFDSDKTRLKFLTETHPVIMNHLFEELIDKRFHLQRERAVVEERTELPDYFKDKYLLPVEKVTISDDFRGIPETKYYDTSANEFFVEGIGWLDNDAYDREQKKSGLTADDFYKKVTKINAHYIDAMGMPGDGDMTPEVYALMQEKTYAHENEQEYARFKEAHERRLATAGVVELPTEYYGVRQNNNNKYAVVGIAADGIVTVVKDNIPSVAEAKTALLDVFEQRKTQAHVELVHPQTIDEISAKMYEPNQGLLKTQYRIEKCDDKPDSTHMLTKYTLDEKEGTYTQTGILCYGDYFKCNDTLKAAIAAPAPPTPPRDMPTFEIYQLKVSDETREIRFISLDSLTEQGKSPDISTYDKMYEGDFTVFEQVGSTIGEQLEALYTKFNMERPADFKGHSLSVSDVVVIKDKPYYVDSFGFKELPEFKHAPEREQKQDEQKKATAQKKPKR